MKIKEKIKKSGDFWLPTIPDRKVPGTLSISAEVGIELEILQPLEPDIEAIFSRNMDGFNRVVGHVQEYGYVTLDGCEYKTRTRNMSQGILKVHSALWANRVFTGVAYPENAIPSFNTFMFSIEGLDEWVAMDVIKTNYEPKEQIKIVSYKPIHSISFNLANGMQLEIMLSVVHNSSLSPREEKITQKTHFKLVSKNDQELYEFISVAQKLTDLLRFATNETVSLDSMSATSGSHVRNIGGDKTRIPINIYSPSGSYPKNVPQISWDDMLFGFSDIHNDAERMINEWIKNYDLYNHAFKLYFSAQLKSELSLESKFLNLAQGLEVYHRRNSNFDVKEMNKSEFEEFIQTLVDQCPEMKKDWLKRELENSNEVSLRKRIRDIIKPFGRFFGNERKRSKLAYKIAATRNYLTHYNPNLESEAAKGRDLFILCIKMELLFELHFLDLMGFSPEKIDSIVANCRKLQVKCSLPMSSADAENRTSD